MRADLATFLADFPAAFLGADQCRLDVLDRIGRIDRRLHHAVADLEGEIGVNLPDLPRGAFGQPAPGFIQAGSWRLRSVAAVATGLVLAFAFASPLDEASAQGYPASEAYGREIISKF